MKLNVIIVPTHICNLKCTYCYNEDERRPIMSRDTLEVVIRELVTYAAGIQALEGVTFIWHGGEPTVAGLGFFEDAVAIQKKYAGATPVENMIQTNGLLLDQKWLDFFKANNFGLSMSIDGPKDLHDKHRVDARGRGSFDKTIAILRKARETGLAPGVVVTVNKNNIGRLEEIYGMLADEGLAFNVVPIVLSGGAATQFDDFSITPREWGAALIELFDLWYGGEPYVQIDDLVHATRAVMTGYPSTCHHTRNCSSFNMAVDPKGDVYPCGWLSGHAALRYGNLREQPLAELLASDVALPLRLRTTPQACMECEWKSICHGGCMAHSYLYTKDTDGRTFFCESIKMINGHIKSTLEKNGVPVKKPSGVDLMDVLRPSHQVAAPAPRRKIHMIQPI